MSKPAFYSRCVLFDLGCKFVEPDLFDGSVVFVGGTGNIRITPKSFTFETGVDTPVDEVFRLAARCIDKDVVDSLRTSRGVISIRRTWDGEIREDALRLVGAVEETNAYFEGFLVHEHRSVSLYGYPVTSAPDLLENEEVFGGQWSRLVVLVWPKLNVIEKENDRIEVTLFAGHALRYEGAFGRTVNGE